MTAMSTPLRGLFAAVIAGWLGRFAPEALSLGYVLVARAPRTSSRRLSRSMPVNCDGLR
ncbi:hypothetical protein AKJ09_06818 [Labilithrix luteola]|uniref:Uncharacterized protein n=1 Tax=Labilithrix luteola TaxID=1391654 RepID=A0A0K1Q444_9BACT|nr:hypothetical protein AKJ09_06818 [Labilithrix luteola]